MLDGSEEYLVSSWAAQGRPGQEWSGLSRLEETMEKPRQEEADRLGLRETKEGPGQEQSARFEKEKEVM